MEWNYSAIASVFAGISAFLSLITIIANSLQFKKIKRDEVQPYLIANFVECFTEGNVPQVQVRLEGENSNMCQVYLKVTNIGVGIARDVVCIYSDGINPKQAFIARPYFLESKAKFFLTIFIENIIVGNEKMDSCDFVYEIYYKDVLHNNYRNKIQGIYLKKGDDWVPQLSGLIEEPKRVKKIRYPKSVQLIKYLEDEL